MEVFKSIIELIDKIIWPITIVILICIFKRRLENVIDSLTVILGQRGGRIKGPFGMEIEIFEGKILSSEEIIE